MFSLVTSILNYSFIFNMENFTGSIYLNLVFLGISRYVCNLSLAFFESQFKWLGRKLVHIIVNILTALMLLTIIIITHFGFFFYI